MTTRGVPSPIAIHFTIDGRVMVSLRPTYCEALQIPFKPWIRLFSAGGPRILEEHGPMLLIDVVLCSNLFPYNIQHKGEEIFWTLYFIYRGLLLWPAPLDHGLLPTLRRRSIGRSFRGDTIPLLFPRLLC
ncbi:hypothetical protein AAG906_006477 [Vitis piasezkii]